MLEAGRTKEDKSLWQGLDHEFINRGHRVRTMRRASGLVLFLTAVSVILTIRNGSGLSAVVDVVLTLIIGIALAIFIWRIAFKSARELAWLLERDIRKKQMNEEFNLGDIHHPWVIFAPWIPSSRRSLKHILWPFIGRRKK